MAKASVILHCTECGTEYAVTKKCHNRSEADSWESYMQGNDGLCPECWAKEQQRKREIEKAKSAEMISAKLSEAGIVLPDLVGTRNQITWASDIRNRVIENLTKQGLKWDVIANKTYPDNIAAEVAKIFEPSAKVWIELRGKKIFKTYVELL